MKVHDTAQQVIDSLQEINESEVDHIEKIIVVMQTHKGVKVIANDMEISSLLYLNKIGEEDALEILRSLHKKGVVPKIK